MERLGEIVTKEASTDKFLQAVENDYKEEVRVYEATMFSGTPMSTENLMDMIRRSSKSNTDKTTRYESVLRCEYCNKTNHEQKNCWRKNPSLKHRKPDRKMEKGVKRNITKRTCYTCGKLGHIAKDCRSVIKVEGRSDAFYGFVTTEAANNQEEEYMDSGATKHLAPKETDFVPGSLKNIESQGVRQANGTLLEATHAGKRHIPHQDGRALILEEAYLVPSLAIKLISVSALTNSGYEVMFSHGKGEVRNEKGEALKLELSNNAWIFPTATRGEQENTAYLSTTDAALLRKRLGHPGARRLEKAAKDHNIKLKGETPRMEDCEACLLSKPMRNPVASTSTPNGEITVQVDGIPWKNGLKGQQGAITFTHRRNKVVKVYCYKSRAKLQPS